MKGIVGTRVLTLNCVELVEDLPGSNYQISLVSAVLNRPVMLLLRQCTVIPRLTSDPANEFFG